jgi:hypothetical protein
MRLLATFLLLLSAVSAGAPPRTVAVIAERDATLIEDPAGAWANGSGPLFVGRTNQPENSRRRAVIRFDLEGLVPRRAVIESVELELHALPSNLAGTVELHRLLEDWSEGPTFSGGGGGRASQPGDATWVHTLYPDDLWGRPGGRYVARTSAASPVEGAGPLAWTSTERMLADVRLWQHNPERNFGWILVGDETFPQNSTAFASREEPDEELRPRLTIRYRRPGLW